MINLDDITVNTQSSVCIRSSKVLRFDPFKINQHPNDADIIFITHEHYDHFSCEDIKKCAKENTIIIFPKSMEKSIAQTSIKLENRIALTPGEHIEIDGIKIETVPAYNIRKPFHPKRNGWVGYVVSMDSVRFYIAGDTDAVEEARAVKCDVAFIPIGGTYTTNAKEAAEIANAIKPSAAIPIHYGSIVGKLKDADTFKNYVDSDIQIVVKIS